jgi:hypothetical protein
LPPSTEIDQSELDSELGPAGLSARRLSNAWEGKVKAGKLAVWTGAALIVSAMMTSLAIAGDHWKFNIVNKSSTAALEFRTQENGEWSANWISDRIQPGDTFNMDFGTTKGDCEVRTQIHFADGSKFDAPVDYCKVTNLYIHEDKLTWD